VRCVVREDVRALEGLHVEAVRGDVGDRASLERAFAGAGTVFHLAARISIVGSEEGAVERTNVDGVRNVVEACRAAGVSRLVHFSSIHALHDRGDGDVIDEDSDPADLETLPAYDRSKAAGERIVREAVARGFNAVIVNPTAIVGPHDEKPSRMGRVLLDLAKGRLPALVNGGYNWVDARDVARGAIAAEQKGNAGERYLLSGTWKPIADVAAIVHACGGAAPPRLTVPLGVAAALAPIALLIAQGLGAEPLFTPDSIRALRCHREIVPRRSIAELGWSPRPIETTIADTLAWFRAKGMLR
jgi:dihydroflavonol-4-reductase